MSKDLKDVNEQIMFLMGKNISGRWNIKCKGPVAGLCPAFKEGSREVSVTRVGYTKGRVVAY